MCIRDRILSDGMEYDYVKRGMSLLEAKTFLTSKEGRKPVSYTHLILPNPER